MTAAPLGSALAAPIPTFDARQITDADGVARITLDGQIYTLRITRSGKLILTK
jgi:hemin uptake protein HemP